MGDPKPLLVSWSKAGAIAAGPDIVPPQAKLVEELAGIVSDAREWFLHALPREGGDACYQCTGQETPEGWQVFVQVASYKPMGPLPDDHPDPERRGKVFKVPEVLEEPDKRCSPLTATSSVSGRRGARPARAAAPEPRPTPAPSHTGGSCGPPTQAAPAPSRSRLQRRPAPCDRSRR